MFFGLIAQFNNMSNIVCLDNELQNFIYAGHFVGLKHALALVERPI